MSNTPRKKIKFTYDSPIRDATNSKFYIIII